VSTEEHDPALSGESQSPVPTLQALLAAAQEAFPELRVQAMTPMAAPPYLAIVDGAFAAVYLRPEDDVLRAHVGVAPTGIAATLGIFATMFGRGKRVQLWERVLLWAGEEQGWPLGLV
jgi:hypothetical protein